MDGPALYRILVQGQLGDRWAAWFDGMAVTALPDGTTELTGILTDQAAIHGVLARIRDLGLPLLALAREDAATDHLLEQRMVHGDAM
jgi:hypothetical protein